MNTTTAVRVFLIGELIERRANMLRGFAKVVAPSGMIRHDVGMCVDGSRAWATPSSKPMISKDGVTMKDAAGKIRYSPIITFATKEARDRFSRGVIEAMRLAFPDALADAS